MFERIYPYLKSFTRLLVIIHYLVIFAVQEKNMSRSLKCQSDLVAAVKQGDDEAVKTIIASGANVNTHSMGRVALLQAFFMGHHGCAKALVAAGVDVNAPDRHGSSLLLVAASRGDLQSIKLLLATPHVDLNVARNDGWNALMSAAFKGQAECIRILVDSGADVNATTNNGWTPLMITCSKRFIHCVNFLLTSSDVEVDASHCHGITALMDASSSGSVKCIQSLLRAGADVNKICEDGWSALMYASHRRNENCTWLLLGLNGETAWLKNSVTMENLADVKDKF